MRASHLLLLLLVALVPPVTAGEAFEFLDEEAYDGRSVLHFQSVVLRPEPMRDVECDMTFDQEILHGLVPVGDTPEHALALVWSNLDKKRSVLWVDTNADGRLALEERHELSGEPIELPVDVRYSAKGADQVTRLARTLIIRRSPLERGLQYAVRGYRAGRLRFGSADHAAILVDGNGDGLFDEAGVDRIRVDLNDDRRFDAFAEHYPLGKPIVADGVVYAVRSDPPGENVRAQPRSNVSGTLRLALRGKLAAQVEHVEISLVSDIGELTRIDGLNEPVTLPVSSYRVSYLSLRLKGEDDELWHYSFAGRRQYDIVVSAEEQTEAILLADLGVDVKIEPMRARSLLYRDYVVTPSLTAGSGLYLTSCHVGPERGYPRSEKDAAIYVVTQGGDSVFDVRSGFA
jgi:hypothetical protein